MFAKRVESPLAISFPTIGRRRNALHSLFCPVFDAVFTDASGRVVDVQARVRPNRLLIVPRQACSMVIEVPPGDSRKVRLGDRLVLKDGK